MIKYFELLLDLLDIEKTQEYLQVADVIEKNIEKDICVYHQYSFLFLWYHKLLKNEISVEDFLQLWDFQSKIGFDERKMDSISFLKWNPSLENNSIYIFDWLAKGIISNQENVYYC